MAYAGIAKAAATSNVSVGVAPANFDGYTPSLGERILLPFQTNTVQNGVWTWQGFGNPMLRPAALTDQYKTANALDNATLIWVQQGSTYAGTCWGIDPAAVVTVDATGHTLARVVLPPVQARACTTGAAGTVHNVTTYTSYTNIDGVTLMGSGLAGSDIVVVNDQALSGGAGAAFNGLYWANTSGAMARCSEPLIPGRAVIVGGEGTANAHAQFVIPQAGNVIQVGTTGLTLSRQNVFNVQDFGAAADGTTNDHAAIVAAIAAASAAGGGVFVHFPPTAAAYACSGAVSVPTNCTIQGALSQDRLTTSGSTMSFQGSGSGFVLAASAYDITIRDLQLVTDTAAGPAIGCAAGCVASTIELRNLKLTLGNGSYSAIAFGTYASPVQATPVLIDHVNISGPAQQSVPLLAAYGVSGGLNNITIRNCIFTGPSSPTGATLSGTVTLSINSPNLLFSVPQTLAQGQLLQFSAQLGTVYEVATATSGSLTATLTQAYWSMGIGPGYTTVAFGELVHIESTDAGIISNVAFESCVFEVPYAGAIKLRGVRNSRIVNCWMGDLSPTAPIGHQIWIGRSTAAMAAPVFNISIENLQADSGVQDAATVYTDGSPIQSVRVVNSTVPCVQNVPTGGSNAANQGYIPIAFVGSDLGSSPGYVGDQPTGELLNTFARFWAHAEAPEAMALASGLNSNVIGVTGNLRGAYRISGPGSPFQIDGIQTVAWANQPVDGVELRLHNPTAWTMTIVAAANSVSSAGYKITTPTGQDVVVPGGGLARFFYDLTSSTWVLTDYTITPSTQALVSLALTPPTLTLTPAQYAFPYVYLTGTLSGNVTVILPSNVGQSWTVDATGAVLSGHTITLQANGNNWGMTIGVTDLYQVTYGEAGKLFGTTLTP